LFEAGLGVFDLAVEFGEGVLHVGIPVVAGGFHEVQEPAFLAAQAALAFFERGDGGGSAAVVQLLAGLGFEIGGGFLGSADDGVHQRKVEVAEIEPFKNVFGGGAQAVVALGDGLGERGVGRFGHNVITMFVVSSLRWKLRMHQEPADADIQLGFHKVVERGGACTRSAPARRQQRVSLKGTCGLITAALISVARPSLAPGQVWSNSG